MPEGQSDPRHWYNIMSCQKIYGLIKTIISLLSTFKSKVLFCSCKYIINIDCIVAAYIHSLDSHCMIAFLNITLHFIITFILAGFISKSKYLIKILLFVFKRYIKRWQEGKEEVYALS